MPKKAVLVDFNIRTRVIVDIPSGLCPSDSEAFEKVSAAAINKVRNNTFEDKDYPYIENIGDIEEDIEIPYGEAPEDK